MVRTNAGRLATNPLQGLLATATVPSALVLLKTQLVTTAAVPPEAFEPEPIDEPSSLLPGPAVAMTARQVAQPRLPVTPKATDLDAAVAHGLLAPLVLALLTVPTSSLVGPAHVDVVVAPTRLDPTPILGLAEGEAPSRPGRKPEGLPVAPVPTSLARPTATDAPVVRPTLAFVRAAIRLAGPGTVPIQATVLQRLEAPVRVPSPAVVTRLLGPTAVEVVGLVAVAPVLVLVTPALDSAVRVPTILPAVPSAVPGPSATQTRDSHVEPEARPKVLVLTIASLNLVAATAMEVVATGRAVAEAPVVPSWPMVLQDRLPLVPRPADARRPLSAMTLTEVGAVLAPLTT